MSWVNLAAFVGLGLSIIAVITFGGLMVLDRDRGEPVSSTSPVVRAFQIAIGVMIISSAGAFAAWLIS